MITAKPGDGRCRPGRAIQRGAELTAIDTLPDRLAVEFEDDGQLKRIRPAALTNEVVRGQGGCRTLSGLWCLSGPGLAQV
jgi:hypothetical protein